MHANFVRDLIVLYLLKFIKKNKRKEKRNQRIN